MKGSSEWGAEASCRPAWKTGFQGPYGPLRTFWPHWRPAEGSVWLEGLRQDPLPLYPGCICILASLKAVLCCVDEAALTAYPGRNRAPASLKSDAWPYPTNEMCVTVMCTRRSWQMTTNPSGRFPDPQERAQRQEDRADRDQDHRHRQFWAEFGMRSFLLVLLVVAGFLAIHASGWEVPGVTAVFLLAPKRRHSTGDPPAQKARP